jgi:hypothetical protein
LVAAFSGWSTLEVAVRPFVPIRWMERLAAEELRWELDTE